MPNFVEYHESLTDELHALKNRIRNLTEHWGTDGEYKEAALRAVLQRHLATTLIVGRGFIVTEHGSSTQIDILIVDGNTPTLFRDGDLMLVTPDCVRAVIEVKTEIATSGDATTCAIKLAEIGKLCRDSQAPVPWLGLFSYECPLQNSSLLLNALATAYDQSLVPINAFAYGKNRFIRFWKAGEREHGDAADTAVAARWRSYKLPRLASAYFVGNTVDALSTLNRNTNAYAWYPLKDGKRVHMEAEQVVQRRGANGLA